MEIKGHIVNCFGFAIPFIDAEVGDVIQSHLHIFTFSDVHECWHQFWNLNLAIFLLLKFLDGFFGTVVDKDGSISQHGFISFDFFFDFCHFLQCFVVFLLVDIVNNHGVISFDQLCIFDAFVNFAMALEHLEDGLLVNVALMLSQEGSELIHFDL